MTFSRYPHVKGLLCYYAKDLGNKEVARIIDEGISSESDAEILSRFIWNMADKMSEDCNNDKAVLGQIDNSDALPDIEYEVTLNIDNSGFIAIWDSVSDEENP